MEYTGVRRKKDEGWYNVANKLNTFNSVNEHYIMKNGGGYNNFSSVSADSLL